MSTHHVKSRPGVRPDFYAAEAAGLAWLADAGCPVVDVVEVDADRIVLRRLEHASPSRVAAQRFGRDLARTHAAGAAHFGSPPDGFEGQTFIGHQEMESTPSPTWGRFYAEQRVLPFVGAAVVAGNLEPADEEIVRSACERIADGMFDDDEPPARLHGDLWNGNVMWTPDGVVLIDPAAHGGHRETDLAMLDLFGCPHLDAILDAYDETAPLRTGWVDRVPLHQLHPLAVHAAGHGPRYGRALGAAARALTRYG